jgi:hypothetical protein
MTYAWDASGSNLVMNFTASPGNPAGTSASVTLTAYDDASFFDLTFRLLDAPSGGGGYFWLLFPSEILFDTTGEKDYAPR